MHQPNLRLFADSDSRASYGYRIITGAYTASLWRMTFGYAPPIEWDARIKGRGVVGIGEASSLIHHAQIAWLPAAERRRYALTGPPPPDWHAHMRPRRGSRPACWPKAASSPAPPSSPSPPARCPPLPLSLSRPDSRHPRQRKHCPVSRPGTPPRTRPMLPRTRYAGGGDHLITGIAAAAGYLGYDKPDSFRRARTRHPIPGETRTPEGRPAWNPQALLTWYRATEDCRPDPRTGLVPGVVPPLSVPGFTPGSVRRETGNDSHLAQLCSGMSAM